MDSASLGAVVFRDRINIGNPDDVGRCLGRGDPAEVFYSFFTEFFAQKLKASCRMNSVMMVQDVYPGAFHEERREGSSGKESWDLMVPSGAGIVSDTVRYLLIFSRIAVWGEENPWSGAEGWNLLITGSSTLKQASLKAAAMVALWDNVEGREVAYGRLVCTAGSQMVVSKSTWFEMLDGIAREFAEKCLLVKK
jgi:hypothetical protein